MNYMHTELASSIVEAAMEVQRTLGGGFPKDVLKRALAAELSREGIEAEVNAALSLFYKGDEVGERKVDVSVEGLVCVELETDAHYHLPDLERAMRHLRASGMDAGLLLNFGPCKLDYIRIHAQGCRSDVLIGDSIQHTPERKRLFGQNRLRYANIFSRRIRADRRRRWIPLWLRGRRLQ